MRAYEEIIDFIAAGTSPDRIFAINRLRQQKTE